MAGKEIQKANSNKQTKDQICEYLEDGLWFKDACVLAGISKPTGFRWRKEDKTFDTQVKASILKYKQKLIQTVNINTIKDGRVGLQVLKTRWPKEWNIAKRIELQHGGEIKHTVKAEKDEAREFAEDLLALTVDRSGDGKGGKSAEKNLPGVQDKSGEG